MDISTSQCIQGRAALTFNEQISTQVDGHTAADVNENSSIWLSGIHELFGDTSDNSVMNEMHGAVCDHSNYSSTQGNTHVGLKTSAMDNILDSGKDSSIADVVHSTPKHAVALPKSSHDDSSTDQAVKQLIALTDGIHIHNEEHDYRTSTPLTASRRKVAETLQLEEGTYVARAVHKDGSHLGNMNSNEFKVIN